MGIRITRVIWTTFWNSMDGLAKFLRAPRTFLRSPEVQKATHRENAKKYVDAQKFREAVIEFQR